MEIVRQLGAAIMPGACLLCGTESPAGGRGLCPACLGDLPRSDPSCYRCGASLPREQLCGACLNRPPAFDRTLSAYAYRYPVDHLIHRFKYRRWLTVTVALVPMLIRRIREEEEEFPDALLPVPLYPGRLRQRGYNQALEIARVLGRELGISVAGDLAWRRRSTLEQARLPAAARRRNIRGAFALRRPPEGRHLAIVDDVMTTGATAGELAKLLRRNGVETVSVWVLARTQGEG
ncbi:MAG: ComF family protein [Gammaproteobacteria bacterium]